SPRYRTIRTIRLQRRVHPQRKTRTHRTHRTASMGRVHAPSSHPNRSEKRQSNHLPDAKRNGDSMSKETPYTKVELVEERHPNQPENSPLVKPQHVPTWPRG